MTTRPRGDRRRVRHERTPDAGLPAGGTIARKPMRGSSRAWPGDKTALAELYDRFSRPLYATALRNRHDPTEAQDLVHDTFIALWEKASASPPSAGPRLRGRDARPQPRDDRVRSRRRRGELLALPSPVTSATMKIPARAPDASAALGDQATRPRRRRHAARRAENAPWDWRSSADYQQEIAEKLSEPLGTVKARIRFAASSNSRGALAHRL